MTTNDNKWQRVRIGDITCGNEWQQITRSGSANENEGERMRAGKREWFWFQNGTRYPMYNNNIFSNIDYL